MEFWKTCKEQPEARATVQVTTNKYTPKCVTQSKECKRETEPREGNCCLGVRVCVAFGGGCLFFVVVGFIFFFSLSDCLLNSARLIWNVFPSTELKQLDPLKSRDTSYGLQDFQCSK